MQTPSRSVRCLQSALALLILFASFCARAEDLRVLVVGGGPQPAHNQIAIESNVRYLLRLLPDRTARTVLFADGDKTHETVLFEERVKEMPTPERLLALLLQKREDAYPTAQKYRAPTIPQMDGPAKKAEVAAAFERLRTEHQAAPRPTLLYFTGHGSQAKNFDLNNNVFDLWGTETLSVRELASQLVALPADKPLTLVMVQCFSGAFANLLFEDGDPKGAPIERDIAGFFATVKERVAAGCTPELDESEYHDFTSYFFAALTGRDRIGRRVKGADYNRNGRVGMDEAFCYALIHDKSIDIPVCTSDVFLRRFITTPDEEVFKTSYSSVLAWASAPQRAALEELSRSLDLSGEDRAQAAYERFKGTKDRAQPRENPMTAARRAFFNARQAARETLFARWPDLRDPKSSAYAAARKEALESLGRQAGEGKYRELLDAERGFQEAEKADYQRELAEARQTRFVRLFKSVALTHTLRTGEDAALKRRFERLVTAEARTLLPAADSRRAAIFQEEIRASTSNRAVTELFAKRER